VLLTLLAVAAAAIPAPAHQDECRPSGDMSFACGIPAPEDLVAIAGSPWIVASSMPQGTGVGGIYLINSRNNDVHRVDLAADRARLPAFASGEDEAVAAARCAPLDAGKFVSHGLSFGQGKDGIHRLYVVGHGGREAVELFNVDARGDRPVVRWAGCVPMPEGVEANSVAALPEGGFLVTTLYDPGETAWPVRMGKLASAAPVGAVFEWHAASGFTRLAIPPISGPNGIAVSADGGSVYLAGWGDRIVRRIDRSGRELAKPVKLDFLPDNLHWAPDGSLLVAGQPTDVQSLFACATGKDRPVYCVTRWSAARLDATRLDVTATWGAETEGAFGDATATIIENDRLFIGSLGGSKVAVVRIEPDKR
jgi:hypothetical protein